MDISNNITRAITTEVARKFGLKSDSDRRLESLARNTRIREGSAKAGVGTKPATFTEISRASKPSKKGSCARRRAGLNPSFKKGLADLKAKMAAANVAHRKDEQLARKVSHEAYITNLAAMEAAAKEVVDAVLAAEVAA